MTETYKTARKSLALVLDVEASEPCELRLLGYDADRDHSAYFERRLGHKEPFAGRHRLVFPLPVSPERLRIKLTPSQGLVVVHGYESVPLERAGGELSREDADFVAFATWVAINLPQLPPSRPEQFPYQSAGGTYMLLLREKMSTSDGQENSTPARISRRTGVAEVSKSRMLGYTVQMRLLILLHEYMHFKWDSKDESACDLRAVALFCDLGYSALEALSTFTKIFDDAPDKPQLRERVSAVLDALLAYQQQEPRYAQYLS